MPHTNASFSPFNRIYRIYRLERQLEKLDGVVHENVSIEEIADFDANTEKLLINLYSASSEQLESYKYATLGEAEAIVNLPESAQQPLVRDVGANPFTKDDRCSRAVSPISGRLKPKKRRSLQERIARIRLG